MRWDKKGRVEPLTMREVQLLQEIAQGTRVKDMPKKLGVGYRIVNERIAAVKGKLGVRNRSQLVTWYVSALNDLGTRCQCDGQGRCRTCRSREVMEPALRDMRRREQLLKGEQK